MQNMVVHLWWRRIPLLLLGIWVMLGIVAIILSNIGVDFFSFVGFGFLLISIVILPILSIYLIIVGIVMLVKKDNNKILSFSNLIIGMLLIVVEIYFIILIRNFRF